MNETSIEKAVMDIITEVDLQEKTDVAAKKLSGGQKRKLSVRIVLIGDQKIQRSYKIWDLFRVSTLRLIFFSKLVNLTLTASDVN